MLLRSATICLGRRTHARFVTEALVRHESDLHVPELCATYVALAETLDARLVTTDAGLARAVRSHVDINVIDASGPRLNNLYK